MVDPILTHVLVHHQRTDITGCGCGWSELGKSWAEHVARAYEQALHDHRNIVIALADFDAIDCNEALQLFCVFCGLEFDTQPEADDPEYHAEHCLWRKARARP